MAFVERIILGLLGVAMLVALHGITIVLFASHGWKPMSASDWGTWVGAIGTVGTLIGAIWIAREGARRQHRTELDAAILGAAAINMNILSCVEELRGVIREMRLPVEDNGRLPPYLNWADRIRKQIFWKSEELTPMIVIPNRAAAKLAMSKSWLFTYANDMVTEPESDWDLQETGNYNRDMADVIEASVEYLESAHDECTAFLEDVGFL